MICDLVLEDERDYNDSGICWTCMGCDLVLEQGRDEDVNFRICTGCDLDLQRDRYDIDVC